MAEALGLGPDVVFDLEISPNRSDCFSISGIARDLAAGLRLPFSVPEPPHVVAAGVARANVAVDKDASSLCRRFTGTVIEAVATADVSPIVRRRLTLTGMRPINPIVDTSNYVMLELGQPNHPYDIDQLGGEGLMVRRAHKGEEIVTLDGTRRHLSIDDCVIADADGIAVGLAGIMGGATAEISASTSTVLLEAANFDPQTVSATGKRLGLLSEARTRFERGVDIELADKSIDRFVQLLGPGVRRGETTDILTSEVERTRIQLRTERVNRVLGTSLLPRECSDFLAPLGFATVPAGELNFDVTVPTWRPDCRREVDLIEEVARMYGYENISRLLPPRSISVGGLNDYQKGRRRLREILTGVGAHEGWTGTFLSRSDLEGAGFDASVALELENPLDQSQNLLRTSLLPGLLNAARFNAERQAGALSLFEVGSVFRRPAPGSSGGLIEGVMEWEQLALVALGESGVDASYAVEAWEVLARGLRLGQVSVEPLDTHPEEEVAGAMAATSSLHAGRRAAVGAGQGVVGLVGELAPEIAVTYDLAGRVAVLIVDLAPLLGAPKRSWEARAVSRFPAVDLDIAFVTDETVPAGEVAATICQAAGELAESVGLFDVWRDPSLGEGRRSLAFRARLRAAERTLTEPEVAEVRETVVSAVQQRHGAVVRGA